MSHPDDRPSDSVSEKKRMANRANARKSTGPKTAAGKARVSLNALTHGMTSTAAVLPLENQDHFDKFALVLRAELKPRGFVQTLMVERLIEVSWKMRRAAKAISQHAARRLDEDLREFRVAREEGAWTGPDLPVTGTEMLVDSAEGKKGAAAFLRLDLYADRMQRAFQAGLTHFRREQKRQAEAGDADAGEVEAAEVSVQFEGDEMENARFRSKATRDKEADEPPEDLMRYWVEHSKRVPLRRRETCENANSQNKATAGAAADGTDGAKPAATKGHAPPPARSTSPAPDDGMRRPREAPASGRDTPADAPEAPVPAPASPAQGSPAGLSGPASARITPAWPETPSEPCFASPPPAKATARETS